MTAYDSVTRAARHLFSRAMRKEFAPSRQWGSPSCAGARWIFAFTLLNAGLRRTPTRACGALLRACPEEPAGAARVLRGRRRAGYNRRPMKTSDLHVESNRPLLPP